MTEWEFKWKGLHWRVGHPWGITHPQKSNSWFGPETVTIDNDVMYLDIKNIPRDFDEGTKPWCVGLVTAQERLSYGTYKWKAKLPCGVNLWPALWVTAHDTWPPEIDMIEGYTYPGNYDYIQNCINTNIKANVHYHNTRNVHVSVHAKAIPTIIYKLFKKKSGIDEYSFTWTENYIKFYFNGIRFRTVRKKKALADLNENPEVYPIMNLEINNDFSSKDYIYKPVFEIHDFKYERLGNVSVRKL